MSLVDGYAVVAYDDSLAQSEAANAREHFTVYDLAAGAKKVADIAEPVGGGLPSAGVLAALGGKVLVSWLGPATGGLGLAPTDMAVIDTGTGTASAPATLSDGVVSGLGALVDPASSDVVLYDNTSFPSARSAVVSPSQGTVLWTQQDHNGSLIPLSLHNGTLYGVEASSAGTAGHQLAVKEADGTPAGPDYALAPLAFTADGSPVFIEAPEGANSVTVGVGHAA